MRLNSIQQTPTFGRLIVSPLAKWGIESGKLKLSQDVLKETTRVCENHKWSDVIIDAVEKGLYVLPVFYTILRTPDIGGDRYRNPISDNNNMGQFVTTMRMQDPRNHHKSLEEAITTSMDNEEKVKNRVKISKDIGNTLHDEPQNQKEYNAAITQHFGYMT